ncbi:hypothetical protein F5B20DRAFT_548387 [Whalleya microplaca]|nr:hypothetical protein F5B20DRAFT_548387 [Whalleya microplaca]
MIGDVPTTEEFDAYLLAYEGEPDLDNNSNSDNNNPDLSDGDENIQYLTDYAYIHRTTGEDIYSQERTTEAEQFILQDPHATQYQGMIWDSGAARVSTVSKAQLEAYVRENPQIHIDWTPGSTAIKFGGQNLLTAIGTTTIETPLGRITFYIIDAPTPSLLSLHDADKLKAYYNTVLDIIV